MTPPTDGDPAIPFLDLGRLHASIRSELDQAYARVMDEGMFVDSGDVAAFESAFADAHGLPGVASCGSGTDALFLALRAFGVGPGEEVIVPAMTFAATAEAVVHVGATPVIADVNEETLLLDQRSVDAVRTEKTRAVIAVHLYGHVVPFDDLEDWRSDGMLVIEDAAQAHLATWRGRSVGQIGDATCFSFYPSKNLGALGDGGAVGSQDVAVVGSVRLLRDHGKKSKFDHDVVGWCSRLDSIQAAFLHAKLAHLAAWTAGRRSVAEAYRLRLGDRLVPWEEGAVHHLLVARVPAAERDRIRDALTAAGIGTGLHYPAALSQLHAFRAFGASCPVADLAAGEVLSLPMDPLMTMAEVDRVCDVLASVVVV